MPTNDDASALAPIATDWVHVDDGAHLVQFYESDAFLVDAVARFLGVSLRAGDAAVVIATRAHRGVLEQDLRQAGLDVDIAREQGRYIAVDAAETLSRVMVETSPDPLRFADIVGGLIGRATAKAQHGRVRAFGEMVALLWADGHPDVAIRIEELWNDLALKLPFSLLCAYPIGAFRRETHREQFLRVCGKHSRVIPAESYTTLTSQDERLRAIALLQQTAAHAREVHEAEKRQAEEIRSRLAAIVESSDDAIIGKTLDGIVTSWNRGAERIFGYTAEEMIGQPISHLMPSDRREDFDVILDAIRRGERLEHFDTERLRKDGQVIHVSLTASPIRDGSGRIVGASKIARDVTDRKRADAEREELLRIAERARAEAEAASRAKDEFLAMLGHELRNPLSAVRNAIVAAKLDEGRREQALDIARRQTEQLARLVDDLLDVSRITQGRILLRRERLHLVDVIERAVETTRSLIEDNGHTLAVSLLPEDLRVDGDPTRLEQVITNLLTNAAKYTPRGGRIELTTERDGAEVVLRVRDSGEGIAPELLPRIFDLFVQGERGLARAPGGLGIGLTVVRSLVELHGGRVEGRSEGIGKGAEFVIHLPALPAGAQATPVARPAPEAAVRGSARLLVVEDNVDAAESLTMLLRLLGHHVRVVHDGISALEIARSNVPEVMLIDIGLPGMDGYELARRLRQQPGLERVVLVALTGYGRDEDRERALRAGFDHHLVKPVDPNALKGLVARLGNDAPEGVQPPTLH